MKTTTTKHIFRVYSLEMLAEESMIVVGDFLSMDEQTFLGLN